MNIGEITQKVDTLAQNWEQFKAINERKFAEISKQGAADPLTEMHLKRLNDSIDHYQKSINKIETVLSRPGAEVKAEYDNIDGKTHGKAFCSYLRKGIEHDLINIEQKHTRLSDRNSGYLITNKMAVKIAQALRELSPIRKLASVAEVSSSSLEIIEDRAEASAGWTQEADNIDKSPQLNLSKKVIPVHELYAQPKLTQKLIDDTSIDLESWLANKLINIFERKENEAFISGDGEGKPKGMLTYTAGKEWGKIEQIHSSVNGKITAESIIKLFFSLKNAYANNAKFLMSRDAMQSIRTLKDPVSGIYLWQPGLEHKMPNTLLGAEVVESADMPAMKDGSLSIIFGDFKHAYQIVDRQDIRILRDPFTNKPFVKFYTTKRVGGDVINFEALKIMKLSA